MATPDRLPEMRSRSLLFLSWGRGKVAYRPDLREARKLNRRRITATRELPARSTDCRLKFTGSTWCCGLPQLRQKRSAS